MMNSPFSERLYNLLPAIYRLRDASQPDEPLRTFLAIIEQELELIEADIEGLYENWFIETCEPWVMPYIADLLGIRGLSDRKTLLFTQRRQIANTIRHRRSKGTLVTLEWVIEDVTGWQARVIEFSQSLVMTQHVQHLRPGKGGTFHLRDAQTFQGSNNPFSPTDRTVDIRSFSRNRGASNLTNIGIYLWRLQRYPVKNSTAFAIPGGKGRYTFHPLGYDMPLFNSPQIRTELTHKAKEIHWAAPIEPGAIAADLQKYKQKFSQELTRDRNPKVETIIERQLNVIEWSDKTDFAPPNTQYYYGPERSINIIKNGKPIPPHQVISADLRGWNSPQPGQVAVDVRRGRLMFAKGEEPKDEVRVSYSYGFSGNIGGGPYNRRNTLTETGLSICYVAKNCSPGDGWSNNLSEALDFWREKGKQGIIRIMDNRAYHEKIEIALEAHQWLVIEAADGACPSIHPKGGNLRLESNSLPAHVKLNGLLIGGGIEIGKGKLSLDITHCTLMPKTRQGISVEEASQNVEVKIESSIVGSVSLPAENVTLTISDSIVDAGGTDRYAIAGLNRDRQRNYPNFGPPTSLERLTIFGRVKVRELTLAADTIFKDILEIEREKTSTIRCCYRRLAEEKFPFVSTRYGQAGYAQLRADCDIKILQEAENSSEMGVFNHLMQPQRRANLNTCLREYLNFGIKPIILN